MAEERNALCLEDQDKGEAKIGEPSSIGNQESYSDIHQTPAPSHDIDPPMAEEERNEDLLKNSDNAPLNEDPSNLPVNDIDQDPSNSDNAPRNQDTSNFAVTYIDHDVFQNIEDDTIENLDALPVDRFTNRVPGSRAEESVLFSDLKEFDSTTWNLTSTSVDRHVSVILRVQNNAPSELVPLSIMQIDGFALSKTLLEGDMGLQLVLSPAEAGIVANNFTFGSTPHQRSLKKKICVFDLSRTEYEMELSALWEQDLNMPAGGE